jgi:Cof subfamily protein (haloacid dehalogenase superfamily)
MVETLIVVDIDKTIKPDGKDIPLSITEELNRLKHEGNHIVFATGRSMFDMKNIEESMNHVNHYGVYVNGGVVSRKYEHTHEVLMKKTFNGVEVYNRIHEVLPKHSIVTDLIQPGFDSAGFMQDGASHLYSDTTGYVVVKDAHDALHSELIKMSLIPRSQSNITEVYNVVKTVLADLVFHHVYDNLIIEMSAFGVNKAVGVQQVLNNINPDRIIIAGDNYNDIPLFEWGNTVGAETYAVGNAVDDLKQIAQNVTPDINNGGILNLLKTL